MYATLPQSFLSREVKKCIKDMKDGEHGKIVPYAMALDKESRIWLNPDCMVTLNDKGVLSISKTDDKYEISVDTDCPYRWVNGEADNNCQYRIPVAKVKILDHNIARNGV